MAPFFLPLLLVWVLFASDACPFVPSGSNSAKPDMEKVTFFWGKKLFSKFPAHLCQNCWPFSPGDPYICLFHQCNSSHLPPGRVSLIIWRKKLNKFVFHSIFLKEYVNLFSRGMQFPPLLLMYLWFLATLVALHLTPVSKWVGDSFELA